MSEVLLVMTTFGNVETARAVARELVERRLVACVNLLSGATSLYEWEGALCEEPEVVAILKTTRDGFSALESVLTELHPYQIPEIIALPVTAGSERYLGFVRGKVGLVGCFKSRRASASLLRREGCLERLDLGGQGVPAGVGMVQLIGQCRQRVGRFLEFFAIARDIRTREVLRELGLSGFDF